jgi:hypothetical protein
VTIHQDVSVWAGRLGAGARTVLAIAPGRHAWVQVARGALEAAGASLAAGDGLAASGEPRLELAAREDAEVLVFDLA